MWRLSEGRFIRALVQVFSKQAPKQALSLSESEDMSEPRHPNKKPRRPLEVRHGRITTVRETNRLD